MSLASEKRFDWDVIIIGGGAAGLMAAAASAERNRRTLVIEKNRKIGVKILMSGGTRCNITHDCSPKEIADQFGSGGKFLYKAIGQFPPNEVVRIVEHEGVPTKVESTGKVFPVSDRAIDVRDALVRRAERFGAEFLSGLSVDSVSKVDHRFVCRTPDGDFVSSSLIIACGGKSYPGCGTTGDGYAWAKSFGHSIQETHAALTPLTTNEPWVTELSGITLEHVKCDAIVAPAQKPLATRVGALLFTHFGLSGPEPMNLSRFVTVPNSDPARFLRLDFLADETPEQISARWRDQAQSFGRSSISSLVDPRRKLPQRLLENILLKSGVGIDQKMASFSAAQMKAMINHLKFCMIPISGTRGFDKAEVTAGGVVLREVDNQTMESKIVPRLFFAGEILDVDGPIGGFNFQAAFSTGTMAGRHAW